MASSTSLHPRVLKKISAHWRFTPDVLEPTRERDAAWCLVRSDGGIPELTCSLLCHLQPQRGSYRYEETKDWRSERHLWHRFRRPACVCGGAVCSGFAARMVEHQIANGSAPKCLLGASEGTPWDACWSTRMDHMLR